MEEYLRLSLVRNIERWAPPKGTERRIEFFFTLSVHPGLTLHVLELYRDERWRPDQLVKNPNFEWSWVETFREWSWNWTKLSKCYPTIDVILRNLDKPWDWYILTVEAGTTFADMVTYPNLSWRIEELMFQDISEPSDIEFLRLYKHRYDETAWTDHSKRVKWKLAKDSPDLPWQYQYIKPDILDQSDAHALERIQTSIDWMKMSQTVDAHIILENKHLPWFWKIVSMNPTLTFEQVIMNPDIQWYYARVPEQTLTPTLARKWMAALKIQKIWRRCISDPSFELCRKRLLEEWREFEENVAKRCARRHLAFDEGVSY
jgi:hypothetical protein